ncbi:uncharacterized protein MELLADRAFT_108188 [Melampsora larici-populina 98AG31]|uniref:Uncharacterized protein n=1 Tax=Melampsora larici-populina (strain 98AG31 / pathotype 3-4-7) TaxID=747676 RepID=F4RS98_MELLP|nr:uncharacterized protein MELLADRAFT_108188 [Melampsora larici-populina 98AG31]EGG04730.1 hypothetical protein MELLADRAFT_108188 [Melampsora larici-populina 98AG31]
MHPQFPSSVPADNVSDEIAHHKQSFTNQQPINATTNAGNDNAGNDSDLTDLSDLEADKPLNVRSTAGKANECAAIHNITKFVQPTAAKLLNLKGYKPIDFSSTVAVKKMTKFTKPKAKKAKAGKSGGMQQKPKLRSHEVPQHLRPNVPAHLFRSVFHRRSMVAEYLNRVFKKARVINVDFDLAVAYFLQHTHTLLLGDIPSSVNQVLADFSLLEPLTGRQDCLLECAVHIKQTLNDYDAIPGSTKPFALRYPNLTALNNLAIERSTSPKVVGHAEAVVFLDHAGRVVAISVPPKISNLTESLSGQERGGMALEGHAEVNDIPRLQGPVTLDTHLNSPLLAAAQSPFAVSNEASARLSGAASTFLDVPGGFSGAISSQAVGYGRYSHLSAGMSDTAMAFGEKRQGHPSSKWDEANVSHYNLPTIIQMGNEHAYKREDQARIDSELLWHLEMGRLIIKAFLPSSYSAARQALQVIVKHGTPAAAAAIKNLVNPLGIGRHTMFGIQVDHHRDGHNAPLFASANFFGKNYGGGELILNYLGYAVHGGPGHSVHAAFDILMHGVGRITRLPTPDDSPPQRICMAIYSHADVFAGAARFSGMQQEPKVFSDRRLWIPFYPVNFDLEKTCDIFLAEEKRLNNKHRNEVRIYKAAKAARLAAGLSLEEAEAGAAATVDSFRTAAVSLQ